MLTNDVAYSYALGQVPWGGVKNLGFGRTHVGKHGLYEATRVKVRGGGRRPSARAVVVPVRRARRRRLSSASGDVLRPRARELRTGRVAPPPRPRRPGTTLPRAPVNVTLSAQVQPHHACVCHPAGPRGTLPPGNDGVAVSGELSHVDEAGDVRMVDVGAKPVAAPRAVAAALGTDGAGDRRRLRDLPKGDALAVAARGDHGAKRTSDLILPAIRCRSRTSRSSVGPRTPSRSGPPRRPPRRPASRWRRSPRVDRGPDGLRHGEGARQDDGRRERAARGEDEGGGEGRRPDRLGRGRRRACARTGAATCWRSCSAGRATRSSASSSPTSPADRGGARGAGEAPPGSSSPPAAPASAPRDVTPEATRAVLEREAPGIAEALRADSIAKTPHGLSPRAWPASVVRTLIVNLPGSTGGCRDGFTILRPALGHALELLAGEQTDRQT